jgi:hypothetical protein
MVRAKRCHEQDGVGVVGVELPVGLVGETRAAKHEVGLQADIAGFENVVVALDIVHRRPG